MTKLLAADLDWTKVGSEYTSLTKITPNNYFAGIVQLALIIIVVVCFLFLLIGGFRWLTSKGEKEALAKSQKTISGAIIGLVIALAIFLILGLLSAFTQVDLLKFCIPAVTGNCQYSYSAPSSPGNPGNPGLPVGNPNPGTPPGPVGSCGCGGSAKGQCAVIGDISNDAGTCFECTATRWITRTDLSYSNCNTPISCYTCP